MRYFFSVFTVLLIFISCSGSESDDSSILLENHPPQRIFHHKTPLLMKLHLVNKMINLMQVKQKLINPRVIRLKIQSNNESQANQSENSEQGGRIR